VGVLWGLVLPASLLHPLYQQFCGQGRGRTADLPIFRTMVMRSYSIATVRDLRRKIHAVIGERRRTKANETEIETTRVLQLTTSSAGKRRRKLAQPAQYDPLATLAIAPRPRRPRNGALVIANCPGALRAATSTTRSMDLTGLRGEQFTQLPRWSGRWIASPWLISRR
jgi:hypothetical protein